MAYIDNYTHEELEQIVKISTSYKDFARKIGYSNTPSGDTLKSLQKRLKDFDTSHFSQRSQVPIEKRSIENIFIENSTASQKVMREWYKKGNYTEYKCSICEQEPFWNGQELTLILDHINGINNDDRFENLRWVCPNCNTQLSTTGSKNPNRKNFAKKYYCVDCGCEISKNSTRCSKCDATHRVIPLEKMGVSREELKNLIRTTPFTKIGEKFSVSDNAIRKWCEKFGLPQKKTEINKYTDKEWELL